MQTEHFYISPFHLKIVVLSQYIICNDCFHCKFLNITFLYQLQIEKIEATLEKKEYIVQVKLAKQKECDVQPKYSVAYCVEAIIDQQSGKSIMHATGDDSSVASLPKDQVEGQESNSHIVHIMEGMN